MDRIYTSEEINIQNYHGNHGNIMHSNHGNDPAKSYILTQPNNDFKIFKKHRVKSHLLNLLLSISLTIHRSRYLYLKNILTVLMLFSAFFTFRMH